MDTLKGDSQLSAITQSLQLAGLAGYFEDKQLEATLFAPTDDAIFNAAWADWTADDPRLMGSLLYHSVPSKADLADMPKELRTNLGPDDIVLLRPGADTGRLDRQPALAVVAPITDFHSPPAKVLRSLRTCQGVVHVIDTALEPDDTSVEPDALAAALAKLADGWRQDTAESADSAAVSDTEMGREGVDLLGFTREEGWRARGDSRHSALVRALAVAREAAAKRAREDEEAEKEKAAAEEARVKREREQAELAELSSPGGAAKAVVAAEAAQQKALVAARLAFREAEGTGQTLAAAKAQDWLGAAEYAVEGMASAKEAASWSASFSGLMDQASSAARAAMLLAEVSLAQHTAVAMARTGDWASSLLGGPAGLVLGSEAGKAWAEAALDAHSQALKAASAAGALASTLAAKASAQGVLGSKAIKQPADASTLEAIKTLVQKLPVAERNSLNSLLAAQLKGGGAAGTNTVVDRAKVTASKVKRVLKPQGSWPAAGQIRRESQQEDDSLEEKEQLEQDIADLSGASTGSSFDVNPKKQPKKTAKLQMKAAGKPKKRNSTPSRLSSGVAVVNAAMQKPAAIDEEGKDAYLDDTPQWPDEEYEPDDTDDTFDALPELPDSLEAQQDLEGEYEEYGEESDALVNKAAADQARARGAAVTTAAASGSQPADNAGVGIDSFFAEGRQPSDLQRSGNSKAVLGSGSDAAASGNKHRWASLEEEGELERNSQARAKASENAAAAGGGDSKSISGRVAGRSGAMKDPVVAAAESAGDDLWAEQGDSGALLNTWEAKQKAAEQ